MAIVNGAFHPLTQRAVDGLVANPPQSVVLVGPIGSGRGYVATALASQLLQTDDLSKNTQCKRFDVAEGIDMVRTLQQFVTLKVPGGTTDINRIAVIENADQLGAEAQNALLKTLEEPPANLMIVLTAAHDQSLLPTIRSRTRLLSIQPPSQQVLRDFMIAAGHDTVAVEQALRISAGLPGLTAALLDGDQTHPLYQATEQARQLLRQTTFERLASVDGFAKQKDQTLLTLTMIMRMSQAALRQLAASDDPAAAGRIANWENILSATNLAETQLRANAQTKLTLTNLMLAL